MKDKYIETYSFESVEDFLNHVMPWGNDARIDGYVFRGHSDESYALVPTALREQNRAKLWEAALIWRPRKQNENQLFHQVHAEYQILREFYRLADQRGLVVPLSPRVRENLVNEFSTLMHFNATHKDVWIPADLHEAAALAQHYGMPTRLLDWTHDIFVAMYFAFRGAIDKEGNMCVWAINKEQIQPNNDSNSKVTVNFITPHYSNNPHLNAQKGLFTHVTCLLPHHEVAINDKGSAIELFEPTDRRALDEVLFDYTQSGRKQAVNIFKKFVIPCREARKGCRILEKLGYDASKIFPGYGGIATELLSRDSYYLS